MREPDSAASGIPVADVAVVGAGPAGLATAVYAASEGLSVVVLDERGELCDGTITDGASCSDFEGHLGGPLQCRGDCLDYDLGS